MNGRPGLPEAASGAEGAPETASRRVGPGSGRAPEYDGQWVPRCSLDGEPGHALENAVVLDRLCNYSAFNGYHRTYSDWSSVVCRCGVSWRTKAAYVALIPDGDYPT